MIIVTMLGPKASVYCQVKFKYEGGDGKGLKLPLSIVYERRSWTSCNKQAQTELGLK